MKPCILIAFLFICQLVFCQIRIDTVGLGKCPEPHWPFYGPSTGKSEKKKLKKINNLYFKDKECVYYNYIRDIGSAFRVISETLHKIEHADPKTFKPIKNTFYSYDRKHVFYMGFFIEGADPKTFIPLTPYSYSRDSTKVFFRNCEIEGADLKTFAAIYTGGYYDFAYDCNYLYFYNDKVKIDFETFEHNGYSRIEDKNNLYGLNGTSFDGYLSITPITDALIKLSGANREKEWQENSPLTIAKHVLVDLSTPNLQLQEKIRHEIYSDNINKGVSKYVFDEKSGSFKKTHYHNDRRSDYKGTYRLKDLVLTLLYDNGIKKIYKVKISAKNYLELYEDMTETYRKAYPDTGIEKVLIIRGLHTN